MVQRQKEGFHVRDLRNAGPEHPATSGPAARDILLFPLPVYCRFLFLFLPCTRPSRQGKRFVVCPRSRLRYRLLPQLAARQKVSVPFRPLFGACNIWLWFRVSVNESTKPGPWSLRPVDLTEPANVPGLQRVLLTAAFPRLLGRYFDIPV